MDTIVVYRREEETVLVMLLPVVQIATGAIPADTRLTAAHREQWRDQQWRYYTANRERLLAKRRAQRAAAKLARTISTSSPAVFRLALPLPDLAEFAHLGRQCPGAAAGRPERARPVGHHQPRRPPDAHNPALRRRGAVRGSQAP